MADLAKYAPEGVTWLRAAVSAIPLVGGPLDHLLFDKADSIRVKNLEAALSALSEQIKSRPESTIDKSWFESPEALAAFKIMADKVSHEPDPKKVDAVGKLVAACGDVSHAADNNKPSVLDHLSRLSAVQIRLLSVIAKLSPKQKKISTGGLEQTASAIWISDILEALKAGIQFWEGKLILDQELEVLESLNVVRHVQLMGPSENAYVLTGIGKLASTYVHTAGL